MRDFLREAGFVLLVLMFGGFGIVIAYALVALAAVWMVWDSWPMTTRRD